MDTAEQTCLVFCVFQAKLKLLQLGEADLIKEIEQVEAALKEEEAQNKFLKRQNDVCSASALRLQASATCSVSPVQPVRFHCRCSPPPQRGMFTSTGRQRLQPADQCLTWNHGLFTQWTGGQCWSHLRKRRVSVHLLWWDVCDLISVQADPSGSASLRPQWPKRLWT